MPEHIDLSEVQTYLRNMPNVVNVHDLHVWGMSTSESALTAHLVIPNGGGDDQFLARIERELHDTFGIEHATIQIEAGGSCDRCRLHTV